MSRAARRRPSGRSSTSWPEGGALSASSPAAAATAWIATGPEDAPAIVFLHGTRLSQASWNGQVRRLGDEFRCVTLDLPGHGVLVDEPFSLGDAVDYVATVVAEAVPSGRAVLVGTSLGGYVALETAVRHPERVVGLVLAACSVDPVGPTAWLFRLYATVLERVPHRILDALAGRFFRTFHGAATGGAIADAGFAKAGGAQSVRSLIGVRFGARLFDVWVPVLIMNGAFDLLFAPGGDAWAAAARRGRHVVLRGAGHLLDLDRPATFAAQVRRFVRESSGEAEPGR